MGDDKKKPTETASPKKPLVLAFCTIGDTRLPKGSPHPLSELMARAAGKILGANVIIAAKDSVDATKQLEAHIAIKDGVPERFLSRVMFVGHGGPKDGTEGFFAFSGIPPADPSDVHNFLSSGRLESALTGPNIDLLDALGARFTIGQPVEVWFVCCYSGNHMAKACVSRFAILSKQKKSGSVSGYTSEIGFGWDGSDPILRLEPKDPIAPGLMQFEVTKFF